MPGFSCVFVDRPSRRCICPICRLPMREPVQIKSCGHRFCDLCLQEMLSGGVFKCPEDDKPLDYAKLYLDKEVEGEIMGSVVRCPHAKDGCRWMDRLTSLQSHLDTCLYQSVPCPKRCTAHLLRLHLDDHLEYLCTRRRVMCDFCQQEFTGDYMDQTHAGNCPREVVWCENKCGAKLERRFLTNHVKNECHKRTVHCAHCGRQFVQETLQAHQYQCPRFPVACPNRCEVSRKMPREQLETHVQDLCPSALIPCPFKDAGCKVKCPRHSLDRHLDASLRTHLGLAWDLVRRQQQHILQLTPLLHTATPAHLADGTFLWPISSYKARYMDAVYKSGCRELTSRPFYLTRYGYKAAMSVFLNGNGGGEGKFLSVYIKLLPGEYDNILDWPFRLPVSFTLFDQNSDKDSRVNLTQSFVPDPSRKHFQKPEKGVESLGFGYPRFVTHDVLRTRSYVRDDVIILKVTVDSARLN